MELQLRGSSTQNLSIREISRCSFVVGFTLDIKSRNIKYLIRKASITDQNSTEHCKTFTYNNVAK